MSIGAHTQVCPYIAGGPFSGEVRQASLIAASSDPVAIDVMRLAILKTLGTTPQVAGISPWEQPVLKRAVELELGATSPLDIELISSGVEEIGEIKNYLAEMPEQKAA